MNWRRSTELHAPVQREGRRHRRGHHRPRPAARTARRCPPRHRPRPVRRRGPTPGLFRRRPARGPRRQLATARPRRTKRFFTEAQRVALATTYDQCAAEHCDRPYAWTDLHHEDPWAKGGPTDLHLGVPCAAPTTAEHTTPIRARDSRTDSCPTSVGVGEFGSARSPRSWSPAVVHVLIAVATDAASRKVVASGSWARDGPRSRGRAHLVVVRRASTGRRCRDDGEQQRADDGGLDATAPRPTARAWSTPGRRRAGASSHGCPPSSDDRVDRSCTTSQAGSPAGRCRPQTGTTDGRNSDGTEGRVGPA